MAEHIHGKDVVSGSIPLEGFFILQFGVYMAGKKKQNKEIIALACTECKRRNYTTTKNRKLQDKIELMKYCKWDKKHKLHKETKVK